MPDRSEAPLRQYLDLCDEARVQATFFFLGWYAQRFPQLVREVVGRGHEAGCHSLFHEDAATLSTDAFAERTSRAKDLIEQASGRAVVSYRAPSFSLPINRCAELFGVLARLGFRVDSSVCTAGRLYGGGFSRDRFAGPRSLMSDFGVNLIEVPVPGVRMLGREMQIFGGGYLRLAPQPLLDRLVRREGYQVLYLHPHDFDRDLPDLPGAGRLANLRRRATFGRLDDKVRALFASSQVMSCAQLLNADVVAA
jgi:polysaccharide deacetylase family protein (PEP-CTERM system associated)